MVMMFGPLLPEVVGEGDKCARFGGDEFLILSPNRDAESAMDLAKQVLNKLSRHEMPLAGVTFKVSIGISIHDGAAAEFAKMYADADAALQYIRSEGKTRIGLFTPPTKRKPHEALQTVS
jgi:diguanylate cyclase (GGDEF)-like protein